MKRRDAQAKTGGGAVRRTPRAYPFAAIVGQEEMKLALLLAVVEPAVGGVLVMGHRGTGKSTAVRALAELLPPLSRVAGCAFNCDPAEADELCDECRARLDTAGRLPRETARVPVVELPLNATEDRLCGTLDIGRALRDGARAFEPGLLARAHRGFLYIDEVNLLEDHLVDLLLDASAAGRNRVEREGVSAEHAARFVLVGSGNPEEGELRPQLVDRFGLCAEVRTSGDLDERVLVVTRREAFERDPEAFRAASEGEQARLRRRLVRARRAAPSVEIPAPLVRRVAALCQRLALDGHRGELTLARAARALAALEGRREATGADVRRVAPLALRHRLRRDPLEQSDGGSRVEQAVEEVFGEDADGEGNSLKRRGEKNSRTGRGEKDSRTANSERDSRAQSDARRRAGANGPNDGTDSDDRTRGTHAKNGRGKGASEFERGASSDEHGASNHERDTLNDERNASSDKRGASKNGRGSSVGKPTGRDGGGRGATLEAPPAEGSVAHDLSASETRGGRKLSRLDAASRGNSRARGLDAARGRYVRAEAGSAGGGARLALDATLRAATARRVVETPSSGGSARAEERSSRAVERGAGAQRGNTRVIKESERATKKNTRAVDINTRAIDINTRAVSVNTHAGNISTRVVDVSTRAADVGARAVGASACANEGSVRARTRNAGAESSVGEERGAAVEARDLRFKRFSRKAGTLFIFAVDASGSMAFNRIRQAKGALARLLRQSYVERDRVALVSFRERGAQLLLRPSRSVALAKSRLDALPVGGATPLAAGLVRALEIARAESSRGVSRVRLLVFTDGRANVPLCGEVEAARGSVRERIRREIERVGAELRRAGVASVVIDTRGRFTPGGEGEALAEALGGSYARLGADGGGLEL